MIEDYALFAFKTAMLVILVRLFWIGIRQARRYFSNALNDRSWEDIRNKNVKLMPWDQHFYRNAMQGSERGADRSLSRVTHRPTRGVRLATLSALIVIAYGTMAKVDVYYLSAFEAEFGTYPVTIAKFVMLAILAYNALHQFVYEVAIDDDQLILTGAFFQRLEYDLKKLDAVDQNSGALYRLRFSDGKTVRILKYVTGHDELVQALENVLAVNQERTCPNSPKLKRSAVA